MTIDERVDELVLILKPWIEVIDVPLVRKHIKNMCLEVARDQRHACASAVSAAHLDTRGNLIDVDVAHQAVMNATLETK